tara:strand:+ start:284 stop:1399 length:1116 start_codon:yes stop_codon:yes gene_type:complete
MHSMNIPIASPSRELQLINNFHERFNSLLNDGIYIGGSSVADFENNMKKFLGSKYIITLNSGTDALLMSLVALGIKKGDEVLVPSFTFFASVECILHLGAIPVFVDINTETFCMDVSDLLSKITKNSKAIMPVHLFGNNSDINQILEIAKNNNLLVVEDVAQAFGSQDEVGEYLGTKSNIGAFSFFPSKTLGGIGDGGMVATDNKESFDLIVKLKNHGQSKNYEHVMVGHNSRLDSLNAFVLDEKLKIFNQIKEGREKFFKFYIENFSNISWLDLPIKDSENTLLNYFTVTLSPDIRNKLSNYLNDNGISNSIYYKKPIHLQEALLKFINQPQKLPKTEIASKTVLSLPYYSLPTDQELDYLLSKFEAFKP